MMQTMRPRLQVKNSPLAVAAFAVAVLMLLPIALLSSGLAFGYWGGSIARFIWPINGMSVANKLEGAAKTAGTSSGFDFAQLDDPAFGTLSNYALRQEPTNTDVMRIAAIHSMSRAANLDLTKQRMLAVDRLTKRDRQVNLWLAQHYIRDGDLTRGLSKLDQLLRVLGDSRGPTLRLMSQVLRNRESIEPLRRILTSDPVWSEEFWHVVSRNPGVIANGAMLRAQVLAAGAKPLPRQDTTLLIRLAEAGFYQDGARLYAALTKRQPSDRVNNSSFDQAPQYPPFDWQLTTEEGFSVSIDPLGGHLEAYASAATSGEIVRQLVKLQLDRQYRVKMAATQIDGADHAEIEPVLRCAGGAGSVSAIGATIRSGPNLVQRRFVSRGCTWAWVGIEMPYSSTGYTASIDTLELTAF